MLILQVGQNEAGLQPGHFVNALFKDQFGSPEDYFAGVESVHGWEARQRCQSAIQAVRDEQQFQASYERDDQAAARALLLAMPEPDFMLAVEEIALKVRQAREIADRITKICSARVLRDLVGHQARIEWAAMGSSDAQTPGSLPQRVLA
jgi:DNA-directed RNA polymerase subunit K/omega